MRRWVKAKTLTPLHRCFLDSGSSLAPLTPSHWVRGWVRAGNSWAPASWSIFGQYLVSLRQDLEGLFSSAGTGHGTAAPPGMEGHGNGKLWLWGCFTVLEVDWQYQRSNCLVSLNQILSYFFKERCYTPAHYTGLSLLQMRLMVKLPPREACPPFRSSQGLVGAVGTTTMLFAIKKKINF